MLINNLSDIVANEDFSQRHIGPNNDEQGRMLQQMGYSDMASFIDEVVPESIRQRQPLELPEGLSEQQALQQLRQLAQQNQVNKSYIGLGYYGCYTPHVILRNVLENPAWYTAYTPYQPEISQGRLEALLNFQTMITDLTGMAIANASLLDEGTAAAEAMSLCQRMAKSKSKVFFVDENCLPQTIAVIQTRAEPLDIEVVIANPDTLGEHDCFGVLLQYPGADGVIRDFSAAIETAHAKKALVVMAADLLALTLIQSPGELGADVAIGTSQRFGVPMGFGGPHAGYMAIQEKYKRSIPGRLVGVSQDSRGEPAYRLALQTREQHIRREKATSNICTAQVLLAVMASMYAVYHGPDGLRQIAQRVQRLTAVLREGVSAQGFTSNSSFFDTLSIQTGEHTDSIYQKGLTEGMNLGRLRANTLQISLDETSSAEDVVQLLSLFGHGEQSLNELDKTAAAGISAQQLRSSEFMTHPVFNSYHSETEMLRYLRKLSDKDIALDRAMIPLGSCTMKLNATAEMIPVTWPEFAHLHPFAPQEQAAGYLHMIKDVEQMLCAATGYAAVSLQPNAGSQGEYAGLLAIRAWHKSRGDHHRNVCLIPGSAHGTNPASAQMCGMKVVVVKCDEQGNVDVDDLREKAAQHSNDLSAIMITYPSTHGVFEERIGEVCDIVHQNGGQVYMDGANLNAMVGLCQPGKFGGDVSHLNLHKTFCIPHGGGGPGIGPVAVSEHLAPYLPGLQNMENASPVGPVSAASWGSASILPITWMYIKMMGGEKLRSATEVAILNANYIADRLKGAYPILYTGQNGRVAHECIIDLNPLKASAGVTVDDVAKRLIDFGFHAPTMSFPVAGTLMIEPTESESLDELDRFCDAMLQIREEIALVERGQWPEGDNPLCNAPHTADVIGADNWQHSYSREKAAYPLATLRQNKYWPPVGRIDNVYGDRNLMCSCLPMEAYE